MHLAYSKTIFIVLVGILMLGLTACTSISKEDSKYLPASNSFAVYNSWVLGPRAGFKINSGRRLSFMENWAAIPLLGFPAKISNSIFAGMGKTETQYTFDKRLDSPSSKFNQALIMVLYKRNLISKKQAVKYIEQTFYNRQFNSYSLENMRKLQIPVKPELINNNILFNNWYSTYGFTPEISKYFLHDSMGKNTVFIKKRIKQNMSQYIMNIMPSTIIQAQNMNLISKKKANLMLRLRFFEISRLVLHARAYSQAQGHISSNNIRKFKLAGELAIFHRNKLAQQLEDI